MTKAPQISAVLALFLFAACSTEERAPDGNAQVEQPGFPADVTESAEQQMFSAIEEFVTLGKDKFMQLAEAIPEDRYDWRPMDGVRSPREVFIHVATINWSTLQVLGLPAENLPFSVDDLSTMRTYVNRRFTKSEILQELERSFGLIVETLDQTRGRLGERLEVGEGDSRQELGLGELWVLYTAHIEEHLGQSIAYARVNDIVPPWSQQSP